MRVSGFVLTNPEQIGPISRVARFTASGVDRLTVAKEKDAGKCRVGKAGSVRLR
jgi:hypothetical protein